MSYRYLALLDGHGRSNAASIQRSETVSMEALGLRPCPTGSHVNLFVSQETPTVCVPGGGVLIGDLFCRGNALPPRLDELPDHWPPVQVARYILEHFWGEYVLFQPTADPAQGITVLRDPSGGLGCVYSLQGGSGFITSDISLAIRLNVYQKQIDWDFIAHCLSYPHLKTSRTGLANVRELLPGCELETSGAAPGTRMAWSPWDFVAPGNRYREPRDAAAAVRRSVASVVKAWAGLDESMLLELSGGLDSSIVAACLRDTPARVVCCTAVAPVRGTDERQYAGRVAASLGVDLHVEDLGFDAARFDFELPSSSVTPRIAPLQYAIDAVLEAAADRHGTVSYISGGGGDTVFCYSHTAAPAADAFKEQGVPAGIAAIRQLAELHQCTFWKAGRLTLKKLLQTPRCASREDRAFVDPALPRQSPDVHPWHVAPVAALAGDRERIFQLAGTQVFRDSTPRRTKRKLRLPLLSQPVMEACLRVPSWMWIREGRNRAIAREAFADALPEEVLARRSKGTFLGYSGAVFRRNKDQIGEFLVGGALSERRLLDMDALSRFFRNDLRPRDPLLMRVIDLCMIENWVRRQR